MHRGSRSARGSGRRRRLDTDQLNIEHQQRARRNGGRRVHVIRELRRNPQLVFRARLHQLQGLGPTRDHLVHTERRSSAVALGGIEHGAVEQLTGVVHRNLVSGLGVLAGARGDDLVLQAAGGGLDSRLLAVIGQEHLGSLVVRLGSGQARTLDQRHDLGLVFLRHLGLSSQCVADTLGDLFDRNLVGTDLGAAEILSDRHADGVAALFFRGGGGGLGGG